MTQYQPRNSSGGIVDFGGHIHPTPVMPDEFEKFNQFVGKKHGSIDLLEQYYDSAGVDAAVLSQPYYMGHDDLQRTRKANDVLLDEISDNDRFYGLAAIPTAAGGEEAAQELQRCLDQGYNGGALATKSDGIELTDSSIEPVLEVADRSNAPVLVHPKLNESLHPDALDDTYRLNAIFGREAALSESICKVIHGGVLDRYPDLNLVYHHLGGNIASMLGRVQLQYDSGRWPNQNQLLDYDAFKRQLEDRIYLDTSGFFGYTQPLQASLSELPSSQLLFGTDVPYEPRSESELRRFVNSVEEVTSLTDSRRILGENTLDLLINI